MDIIILCHTEFGLVRDKKVIYEKSAVSGVTKGVPKLIAIAEKYGAKVTFAVMPEVADYFPKNTGHEIGLHVHAGWEKLGQGRDSYYVGDAYLRKTCIQSSDSSVLRDYSYDEQFGMIKKGKEYLTEKFDIIPKVFVAGRWSLNSDTVKALTVNGFTHDCSVAPSKKPTHHDWSKLPRICMPYHPAESDYQKRGELPLLMVPVSQYFPRGGVNPEIVPVVGLSWLKACFLEYYKQRAPLFHICLHSPAMTDEYFISAMDNLLAFIAKHQNIHFKFASEIKKYPPADFTTNIMPYLPRLNIAIIKTTLFSYTKKYFS